MLTDTSPYSDLVSQAKTKHTAFAKADLLRYANRKPWKAGEAEPLWAQIVYFYS